MFACASTIFAGSEKSRKPVHRRKTERLHRKMLKAVERGAIVVRFPKVLSESMFYSWNHQGDNEFKFPSFKRPVRFIEKD